MPRDIERARDELKSAPPKASDAPVDAEPEPDIADPPLAPARSKMPAIPIDPELLRYRHRLDRQLAAWRVGKSTTSLGTSLAILTAAPAPRFGRHTLLMWITPIAACGAAAFAGWLVASVPATRAGEELAQVRQALQQEQDKADKLVATLAAAWRDLGAQAAALADKEAQEQERDTLQKALQQSAAAAAALVQSLTQERDRNQELEQQLAAHRAAAAAPAPIPAADTTSARPPAATTDPEHLRLMSRASLLLAQGDIGAARVVLELAAESGSAWALFTLAETFDPAILSAWGTVGTQGDPARAGDLYAKALAGGVMAAKDRLAILRERKNESAGRIER